MWDLSHIDVGVSQDGFIHLTQDAELLLPVANHFYTGVDGAFAVLELDPSKLTAEVSASHEYPLSPRV